MSLRTRGFTVVEMLIVLGIIGLLAAVVLMSTDGSRATGRDARRVSDLEQIRLALRLYAEEYGEYPCETATKCDAGIQTASANGHVGEGGHIDTLLAPYMPNIPADPRADSEYYYYYDGNQGCGGSTNQAILFARRAETVQYQNIADQKCTSWGGEGGAGAAENYMIILGPSPDL